MDELDEEWPAEEAGAAPESPNLQGAAGSSQMDFGSIAIRDDSMHAASMPESAAGTMVLRDAGSSSNNLTDVVSPKAQLRWAAAAFRKGEDVIDTPKKTPNRLQALFMIPEKQEAKSVVETPTQAQAHQYDVSKSMLELPAQEGENETIEKELQIDFEQFLPRLRWRYLHGQIQ